MLAQTRANQISGTYVEKLIRSERVEDPFGQQTEFERIEYRRSTFHIDESVHFGLELINPTKSASRLVSRFLELTGYRFSIETWSEDPLEWAQCTSEMMSRKIQIQKVIAGGIDVASGVTGEMVFRGQGDVLSAAASILEGRQYTTDKVQVVFEHIAGAVTFRPQGQSW